MSQGQGTTMAFPICLPRVAHWNIIQFIDPTNHKQTHNHDNTKNPKATVHFHGYKWSDEAAHIRKFLADLIISPSTPRRSYRGCLRMSGRWASRRRWWCRTRHTLRIWFLRNASIVEESAQRSAQSHCDVGPWQQVVHVTSRTPNTSCSCFIAISGFYRCKISYCK